MFTVYILQSQTTFRYYIGYCSNMKERLQRHNSGRSTYSKKERPWIVVYTEVFTNRTDAMKREKQIKSYKGGEAFKKLLGK